MRRVITIIVLGFLALLTLMGASFTSNVAAVQQCAESEFLTTCPVTDQRVTIRAAGPAIEGSWQLIGVGTPENPSAEPMLATFLPDGTLFVSARVVRNANHDLPYNSTYFSTGHGTWQAAADGSISFTVVHLLSDEAGALCGSVTVSGTLVPGADGESLAVDATSTVHSPWGAVQSTVPTTLSGQRIGNGDQEIAIQD